MPSYGYLLKNQFDGLSLSKCYIQNAKRYFIAVNLGDKMKTWKKIAIACITIFAVALPLYLYSTGFFYFSTMPHPEPVSNHEKLAIQAVNVESNNTILVLAQSMNYNRTTVNIDSAIFKDSEGNVVYTDRTTNATLTNGNLTEIKVHYESLPSASYTVTLTTKAGNQFVSPSFYVT